MSGEQSSKLGKEVLRDVSRSFYLTLRALPPGMREATSVGYLLARASDTIADCGGESAARLALLKDFSALLTGAAPSDFFERAAAVAEESGLKEGERVLMRRLDEVVAWWRRLAEPEQEAIREVVQVIISGQQWDLAYFAENEEGGKVVLTEGEQLENYCYQVAGCVGEFWTEIGFLKETRFSNLSKEEMRALGKSYGKGLQLVNILRDQYEDLERGRCYLPSAREEWLARARERLDEGLVYAGAVRGWRARLASVLPALLGLETLKLLENASEEELRGGVKVGRKVVKRCLWRAIWFQRS